MSLPRCQPSEHALHPSLSELDDETLERTAAIFRALGDPGRLRILAWLARGPLCVTELAASLDENVSTVSQRLKLLRSERLARSRREGKHIFYALADRHVAELVANALEHANERLNRGKPDSVPRARPAPANGVRSRKTSR
ncbi:MAG TPA: metalloregulator ArsR/SmtB family transcription factor [Pirellulales bacterium]|jgi:ArsR family transcriptional regulator|nr:metalloregulator ArsR/SmtB family transcription factor [Pirellulales bacterium]